MIVRCIYRQDGGVSIIYPVEKSRLDNEPYEVWLDRVFSKATPPDAEYEDIDSSTLPIVDGKKKDRKYWRGSKQTGIYIDTDAKEKDDQLKMIEQEKEKIIETQAIESLKKSGKLPADF